MIAMSTLPGSKLASPSITPWLATTSEARTTVSVRPSRVAEISRRPIGSDLLHELPDRPDREDPRNALPHPVPGRRHGSAEQDGDQPGLFQEAAQRAMLDHAEILRRPAAQVLHAL